MAIETKKNATSGSTVIDENRGRDDLRHQPKKRGTSKTLWPSLDQRVAVVNNGLRDSFMGEITKIREEFGDEVSTLHQVIEGLQADMALCKRSLASGGKLGRLMISCGIWNNTWKVSTWWMMLPRS
ncbi:hypothetical protein Tco_1283170 [Tanacetum coccineum]